MTSVNEQFRWQHARSRCPKQMSKKMWRKGLTDSSLVCFIYMKQEIVLNTRANTGFSGGGSFLEPAVIRQVLQRKGTMNDWYRLTFSADDIAAAKHLEMEGHFERFFLAAGSPEDATLFRGLEPGQTIYYFSPGAARIAMKLITHLSAVQCPAPPMSAVALIAGHQPGR
jgi:hypothetical protein